MSLLTIDNPEPTFHQLARRQGNAPQTPLSTHPLFRLGFRPFYLLAAAFAGVAIPAWTASFLGVLPASTPGLAWHVHEMIFGFAVAVIIGFLFTAGKAWTGLQTPRGVHLAALAALWLAGRMAMLTGPAGIAAIVDLAFLPLAAWPLYQVLQRAGNSRNLFLVALLSVLATLNAVFHAATLGWLPINPLHPAQSALLVIVIIETAIGGRVIPGFTANAVAGVRPIVNARRDRITMGLVAGATLAWTVGLPASASAGLCFAAAAAILTRLLGYMPHKTVRNPLLWILHLSYGWIAIGLFLLGLASFGIVGTSAAFHALGVGATAGLIIGMLTRTALGHTGRALKAGAAETLMYLLLHAGAVLRVAASLVGGEQYALLIAASTVCWSATFLLYAAVYGPYLFRARIDGRDG